MPTVVSLFSGGGGLDLGFINAGYDIIWAIDNNKNAVETYKANIGGHIICADITEADVSAIPHSDIVIGGPPCQSFSLAGMRHVEDARGKLVWQYMRIIKHIKPKAFVFENVTGLLSAKNKDGEKIVDLLKKAFQDIGYTVEMQTMNAADYGVPQRRKRVFIVGLQGNKKFTFPAPTHNEDGIGLKKYVSVYEALGDLPEAVNDENGRVFCSTPPQNEYQRKMRTGSPESISEHFTPTLSELDRYIISHVKPGGNYMDIPKDVNSKRIRRLQRDGGHTTCYGRMDPDKPSYTINTYFNRPNVGCNIHYSADRLITVREALRLQSFPDSYEIISTSRQGRNLIVGNAVPPMLAEILADSLKNYIEQPCVKLSSDKEDHMITYSDSEVKVFHPLCKQALENALSSLGKNSDYEVLHHHRTKTLEMDFVIRNKKTLKYFCVIEVKRTPSNVQSVRCQLQAQSYVQMNSGQNEASFYILTNLETLISFRYDASKPNVYQQILKPGTEHICDFTTDTETVVTDKLSAAFERILGDFFARRYDYLTTLDDFISYMGSAASDDKKWKSSLAVLFYEFIRGSFHAVKRSDLKYDIRKFHDDVEQICQEGALVDFGGIFDYDPAKYLPHLSVSSSLLNEMYSLGDSNVSGDIIADALHSKLSDGKEHDGEVATDSELAQLASVLSRLSNGPLRDGRKICDPAAGSGNLICSAINAFQAPASSLKVNDINPKLIQLLSLRIGLSFPGSICRTDAPQIDITDLTDLTPGYFDDVDVVLLNPPFVAGINCVSRKRPFYDKIRSLKGSDAATSVGQTNLGAVFLETLCYLVKPGTTIVCIFPKTHLTARGEEAVAFRRMLLSLFGLHTIFSYPAEGLFDSVTEATCIFVGKAHIKSGDISVYSSDEKVADLDLHAFESSAGSLSTTGFDVVSPGIEGRRFTWNELSDEAENGWRFVSSEMTDSIDFVSRGIFANPKLKLLARTTSVMRKGNVAVAGCSDLLFLDTNKELYNKYASIPLREGVRNAKSDKFVLYAGVSKFWNINDVPPSTAKDIIRDYIPLQHKEGKQKKKIKTAAECEKIAHKDAKIIFQANSILVPTKIRKDGRIHVTKIPMYISTNFSVFTYKTPEEAEIIGSYMTTLFYLLECEVESKDESGVRKLELGDAKKTHVPDINVLTPDEKSEILAEVPNIRFLELNRPVIREIDRIWARILFGKEASDQLKEAQRLLRFLLNRRNPPKH